MTMPFWCAVWLVLSGRLDEGVAVASGFSLLVDLLRCSHHFSLQTRMFPLREAVEVEPGVRTQAHDNRHDSRSHDQADDAEQWAVRRPERLAQGTAHDDARSDTSDVSRSRHA